MTDTDDTAKRATKSRLITAGLVGLLSAAALGRAQLGADTEVSILSAPGFFAALLPALAVGWLGGRSFGRWQVGALFLAALTVALAFATGAGVAILLAQAQAGDLVQLARQPLAWGSLIAAYALPQLYAYAQAQSLARRQSRK